MKYGSLKGLDKKVSRLVVGARGFDDDGERFEHFDACFEAGYTVWDTGHSYYEGETDRRIGRWMELRNNREKVVVLEKACIHSPDRKRITPYDLTSELFDCLARLRTDYVDIFMLHRDDPTAEVGPIVEELNKHWEAGRIKVFGASNWTHQRIGEANEYARKHGLQPFTVSGPQFSLLKRNETKVHWWHDCAGIGGKSGKEAREWYREHGIAVFGYSPLAVGFLNGEITPDNINNIIKEGQLPQWSIDAWYSEENMGYLARAIKMAKIKGLTLAQVVLRYITSLASNGIMDAYAVVGSKNLSHIAENAIAVQEDFSAEEIAWLEMETDRLTE